MMTLREMFAKDLPTFISAGGLSKLHTLNGVILQAATRHYTSEMSGRMSDQYESVHGEHLSVQLKAEDLLRKCANLPVEGDRLQFDGRWYDVESCENEFGICRLVLTSYRGAYVR